MAAVAGGARAAGGREQGGRHHHSDQGCHGGVPRHQGGAVVSCLVISPACTTIASKLTGSGPARCPDWAIKLSFLLNVRTSMLSSPQHASCLPVLRHAGGGAAPRAAALSALPTHQTLMLPLRMCHVPARARRRCGARRRRCCPRCCARTAACTSCAPGGWWPCARGRSTGAGASCWRCTRWSRTAPPAMAASRRARACPFACMPVRLRSAEHAVRG